MNWQRLNLFSVIATVAYFLLVAAHWPESAIVLGFLLVLDAAYVLQLLVSPELLGWRAPGSWKESLKRPYLGHGACWLGLAPSLFRFEPWGWESFLVRILLPGLVLILLLRLLLRRYSGLRLDAFSIEVPRLERAGQFGIVALVFFLLGDVTLGGITVNGLFDLREATVVPTVVREKVSSTKKGDQLVFYSCETGQPICRHFVPVPSALWRSTRIGDPAQLSLKPGLLGVAWLSHVHLGPPEVGH